jgi:hypothetical protein
MNKIKITLKRVFLLLTLSVFLLQTFFLSVATQLGGRGSRVEKIPVRQMTAAPTGTISPDTKEFVSRHDDGFRADEANKVD